MGTPNNRKKGTTALNPPFDKRMLGIGGPSLHGKSLRRGWIAADPTTLGPGDLNGRVNFLFNPPQISVSHPLNPAYQSSGYTQQLDAYSARWVGDTLGQAGEVGISLLFDRTYELWDGSYKHTLQGQYGAYVDVLAFYKLLGIVDSSSPTPLMGPIVKGTNRPDVVNFGLFPQQPLKGTPICYLYLGPNSLKFRGFVDNFNITYTHFSRSMIPMRVQIDLSMQMYMDQSAAASGSGGSASFGGTQDPNSFTTPTPPTHVGINQPGGLGIQHTPHHAGITHYTFGGHTYGYNPNTGSTWEIS